MSLTCKVGNSLSFDIVAYVRNKVEDATAPFVVPDAAFSLYIEAAIEQFQRYEPLEDVIGTFGTSPPTSPLQTTAYRNRYICNAANGFPLPVVNVIDVLYRASGVFTAASEIAYLALMPVSPLNWFRIDKDLLNSPTSRHIRDQYLQELDHYGIGYWGRARDAGTGLQAIDIFPTPTVNGLPIFVRYTTSYPQTTDGSGNPQYQTVPEDKKRWLAQFLFAEVLEQECDRLTKYSQMKAGIVQRWSSAKDMRAEAERVREDTTLALNGAPGQEVLVSW